MSNKESKKIEFYNSKYNEKEMKHNCALLLNSKSSKLLKNCQNKKLLTDGSDKQRNR